MSTTFRVADPGPIRFAAPGRIRWPVPSHPLELWMVAATTIGAMVAAACPKGLYSIW